jgi:tetratricopeptide (TPR) repeat protein
MYDRSYKHFLEAGVLLNGLPKDADGFARLSYIQARVGISEYLRGNKEEALQVFEAVLAMRDELNLPVNEVILACANMAASLLQQTGDSSRAEVYFNFALAGTQDQFGMHDPLSVESTNFMANYFLELQDWSKAFEFLQESISWIDKRVDTEQTMWVLDNLISITSLLDNYDLQEKYVETLSDLYAREFNGEFMSDRALVEKGDKGAALRRQEKFQETIDSIKRRYDSDLHPQAAAALNSIDPRVWTAPILELTKRYALHLLDVKASGDTVSIPEQCMEEYTRVMAEPHQKEADGVPAWQSAVETHLAANDHASALGLLEACLYHEQVENGPLSPDLVPLYETQANIYCTTGKRDAARPLVVRAQLISFLP